MELLREKKKQWAQNGVTWVKPTMLNQDLIPDPIVVSTFLRNVS